MQRREFLAASAAAALVGIGSASAQTRAKGKTGMTAYDFEFNAIEGPKLPMANFRGKVVLLVNTASFCGFTPQYRDLEAVYEKYKELGERSLPAWNFHKYLIGRQGMIVGTWPSEIVPTGRTIVNAIEDALKQPGA